MPRWEHGSEDRLKKAALELFDEQGFEKTSVIEIAKRAHVATRTFFRYFPDKREVLFAEADALRAVLVERILQAPDVSEPLQLVAAVLAEFDWESLGSRESQRQRHAVIAANPDLLERDLIKHHSIVVGFTDALRQRGVDGDVARLAATVGGEVFFTAYGQWLEARETADLPTIIERMMSRLASIVPGAAMKWRWKFGRSFKVGSAPSSDGRDVVEAKVGG
jgi:AcrR family transcriptional regulator